ncbi:MAG TPA: neutral/alkaline non-lysosomal ceramidase N-terminal domain-containing protein, partial [Pirellulales bacterium]
MPHAHDRRLKRRDFLRHTTAALGAAAGLPWLATDLSANQSGPELRAGQGVVDVTPPLGIELAGFHRPPDNPRRITTIRQPVAVRAIVLALADTRVAIVSVDILAVSADLSARLGAAVERATGIPAAHVRFAATHTHSMPTFRALRQWGAISPEYMKTVEAAAVRAVTLAKDDLAPAEMLLGKARAEGANFNRTRRPWKTDVDFDAASTETDRWLDTMLHVLLFRRGGGRPDLLWYHFACHPVSYQDEAAGPDWPGLVDTLTLESHKLVPSYLQGHAGDVNPGDGTLWIGKAEPTAAAVHKALASAIDGAQTVRVDQLRALSAVAELPLDLALFAEEIDRYRRDPAACN